MAPDRRIWRRPASESTVQIDRYAVGHGTGETDRAGPLRSRPPGHKGSAGRVRLAACQRTGLRLGSPIGSPPMLLNKQLQRSISHLGRKLGARLRSSEMQLEPWVTAGPPGALRALARVA